MDLGKIGKLHSYVTQGGARFQGDSGLQHISNTYVISDADLKPEEPLLAVRRPSLSRSQIDSTTNLREEGRLLPSWEEKARAAGSRTAVFH